MWIGHNMIKKNTILKLFIANEQTKSMDEVTKVQLQIGGVVGDKYFGRENREVLLTSTYGYELAKTHNISMNYGTLGENILTDMNIKNLQLGDNLKIGEAILEVSMLCPVCTHLSVIKKELPKLIKDDRGIFLKVVKSGTITQNDEIELL
jgi:MOSC domain-containing protein YiiM